MCSATRHPTTIRSVLTNRNVLACVGLFSDTCWKPSSLSATRRNSSACNVRSRQYIASLFGWCLNTWPLDVVHTHLPGGIFRIIWHDKYNFSIPELCHHTLLFPALKHRKSCWKKLHQSETNKYQQSGSRSVKFKTLSEYKRNNKLVWCCKKQKVFDLITLNSNVILYKSSKQDNWPLKDLWGIQYSRDLPQTWWILGGAGGTGCAGNCPLGYRHCTPYHKSCRL